MDLNNQIKNSENNTSPAENQKKSFLSLHKKSIIISAISLVVAACIVFVILKFALPDNTKKTPTAAEIYSNALDLIKKQDYSKAYKLLTKCGDYKDSKELLQGFFVAYEKEEFYNYNINGYLEYNYSTNYKYIYDKAGNLKQIDWYDDSNKLCQSTKLDYHENGTLSHISHYDHLNASAFLTETKYDEYGNIISVYDYDDYSNNSVTNIRYDYDDKGNILHKTEYCGYNQVISDTEYEYDQKGNLTLKTEHNPESRLAKNVYKYEYDSDNKLVLETLSYEHSFGTYEEVYKYKYEYNNDGNITRVILNDDITISEIEYDENGNITLKTDYSKEGLISSEITYENNNVVLEKKYTVEGNLASKKEYKNNNLILEITYSEETGEESVRNEYEYNKKGNATLHTITSYGEDLTTKSIFSNPIIIYNPKNIEILSDLLNGALFHSVL